MKVKIDEIIINDRIREDSGELSDLIESIRQNGLINPVTITADNELLAGYRRLEACRTLGHTDIECKRVMVDSKLQKLLIEVDENLYRKGFTFEEIKKYEEEKNYLTSRGFLKFKLWILRIFRKIKLYIKRKLNSSE